MTHGDDTIANEVHAVRTSLGLWTRNDHTFVRITGADAASWLQSQTTNDVLALKSGEGHHNAALDRQGRLQAHFTLHRWAGEFWMLVERAQSVHLLQHLDAHLFIEDAKMEETGGELDQLVIQGPKSLLFLAHVLGTDHVATNDLLPHTLHGVHPVELAGVEALAFRESPAGEDGYVLVLEKGKGRALLDELLSRAHEFGLDALEVSPAAQEILRIEAGLPRFGADIDNTQVIPETSLERDCISYTKGCYLGQEVVARLKTYGSPKRALMGLLVRNTGNPPASHALNAHPIVTNLLIDGKSIGQITSTCFSPTLNAYIALASLDRDHRTPGQSLPTSISFGSTLSFSKEKVEVRALPFYEAPSREDRAHTLYDRALQLFQHDPDDINPAAIPLLEEALLLHPRFEDAYEVLGVILHRQGRTDDAIGIMRQLAALNPDCLMAHTNLSVFYVAKGLIPEAEEEKAKAAVLQIQRAGAERVARETADAERRRIEDEARERIRMFIEVLDIDPDDPLATFGLGKAYIQLNQFAEALPHLTRATQLQKDYSAAWLDLAKCHEFLGHTADAVATYRLGIAAAARKGDLMPMREMERRLKALEATVPTAAS
jgi:folate-binding protein YgfZ